MGAGGSGGVGGDPGTGGSSGVGGDPGTGGMGVGGVGGSAGVGGTGMGGNSSPYVYGLASFEEESGPVLVATGQFTTAGGASANKLARWNGSSWSQLGGGITTGGYGYALLAPASQSPALWLGGSFLTVGAVASDNIARWTAQ